MTSASLHDSSTVAKASVIARVAIATTLLSLAGMAVLLIGDALGLEGFTEEDGSNAVGNVAWLCFSVGGLIALLSGIAALVLGARRRSRPDRRAGVIALVYVAVAVVVLVLAS